MTVRGFPSSNVMASSDSQYGFSIPQSYYCFIVASCLSPTSELQQLGNGFQSLMAVPKCRSSPLPQGNLFSKSNHVYLKLGSQKRLPPEMKLIVVKACMFRDSLFTDTDRHTQHLDLTSGAGLSIAQTCTVQKFVDTWQMQRQQLNTRDNRSLSAIRNSTLGSRLKQLSADHMRVLAQIWLLEHGYASCNLQHYFNKLQLNVGVKVYNKGTKFSKG